MLSALLQTLNSDPNVNVRLAALDALQKFSNIRKSSPRLAASARETKVAPGADYFD